LNTTRTLPSAEVVPTGYTVLRQLQHGRDVDVYEVWSDSRACRCVAKLLRADRRLSPRPRRRLLREGRLLRRLAHLHLARAYEVYVDPPTVILEILTGKTLARRLEDLGCLGIDETVAIGVQLCSVLHYLHGQPLLHLDIKPSNIVCERGVIKLLDLSIARAPGRLKGTLGTRGYMAPEQTPGGVVSQATDVWGVGVVLFECLTGRVPLTDGRATIVRKLPRRVPPQLQHIIEASLALAPQDRLSLSEVSSALRSLSEPG
jgi:eukaryotic-like serine/threonine-protein kinase